MTRGRILIVEDEADLAWVEQFNLESEGYDVRVALEGRAAIAALVPHQVGVGRLVPCLQDAHGLAHVAVRQLVLEGNPLPDVAGRDEVPWRRHAVTVARMSASLNR